MSRGGGLEGVGGGGGGGEGGEGESPGTLATGQSQHHPTRWRHYRPITKLAGGRGQPIWIPPQTNSEQV